MSTAVAAGAADVEELEPQREDYSADALSFFVTSAVPGDSGLVPGAASLVSANVLGTLREAVKGGEVDETMQGAPMLKLDLVDPERGLLNSGIFDHSVGVEVDGIRWHLVHVDYIEDGKLLTLHFEHEIVTEMRQFTKPIKVSRGAMTRAEFIFRKLVAPIPSQVRFVSPELTVKQRIAAPTKTQQGATTRRKAKSAFAKGARIPIGSGYATPEQLRTAAIGLEEASKLKASPLATLAMICAGLQESGLRDIMEASFVSVTKWLAGQRDKPTNGYGGWLQGQVAKHDSNWFGSMDPETRTREEAKSFLRGTRGYRGGGAMAMARAHPGMTPGQIAVTVEGSGGDGSVYERWRSDAKGIIDAYQGGGASYGGGGSYWKKYEFTRGQPGVTNEDSWAAAIRLSNEVRWRFFIVGRRTVYYVTDDDLMKAPAMYAIAANSRGFVGIEFDVEVGGRYVVRHGQRTARPAEARLTVNAKRWAARPGATIILASGDEQGFGPAGGQWIVDSTVRDLFSPRMTINLRRPQKPLPEPRSELLQRSKSKGSKTNPSNSTKQTVTPARKGSGHYGMLVDGLTFAGHDAGIDFTGTGNIYAPCDLLITRIVPSKADPSSGWMGGVAGQDHVVVGKILSNNPPSGFEYLYFAEAIVPASGYRVGDTVKAGHLIATLDSTWPGCEIGFARDGHGNPWGKSSDGRVNDGPYGKKLDAWLQSIKRQTKRSGSTHKSPLDNPPAAHASSLVITSRIPSARVGPMHVDHYPLARAGKFLQGPYEPGGTHDPATMGVGGWADFNAIDLGVPKDTRVYAVSAGRIGSEFGKLADSSGRFAGERLHLVTADNEWYYAHLTRIAGPAIRPGVHVPAGALLGWSGVANGVAHLHLACENGNPATLLGVGRR